MNPQASAPPKPANQTRLFCPLDRAILGAGEEIRTPDLRITSALLYH